MSNPIKVSVLIPVYGVELYIEKCARSLFEQTLDSIEFIFLDDCSKDKSIEILEEVIKDYPSLRNKITIIHHSKNQGLYSARRTAVKAAKGEYIIHCDSDDWVEKNWVEEMYNHAIRTNSDLVWSNYYKSYPDGRDEEISMDSPINKSSSLADLMSTRRIGSLWSSLVKSEIVKKPEIIWSKGNYGEDVIMVMQYVILCNRQAYLNKAFYHYRVNNAGITKTVNPEKVYGNMETMIEHNKIIQEICRKAGFADSVVPVSIARMFKAKDKILQLHPDDKEASLAWRSFHPELTFHKLFKSSLSLKEKLYSSILILGFFPFVNKYFNLRKRLYW